MQFVVTGQDGVDGRALERRMAARAEHIRVGDEMRDRGELLFAVALLDSKEQMVGSVLIVDFPSRERLEEWLAVEPYVTGKVWEHIEVEPCRVGPSFTRV